MYVKVEDGSCLPSSTLFMTSSALSVEHCFQTVELLFPDYTCKYRYIYIFGENTLGECRLNILKIERRKRGTTGEKKK